MAGATNRQLKKLGFREAGIVKIRTTGGRGISIESAISHARSHGVALPGKALEHSPVAKPPPGWQAAARGEKPKRPEKPVESLESYRARDAAGRDPATMRAAIREQIKKIRSDAGTQGDVDRLSTMLKSRDSAAKQRAAERGGQQDLFGANPAPRGPSPFEVRAKAAAERRAAMVASAQQRTGRLPQAMRDLGKGMMVSRKEKAAAAKANRPVFSTADAREWSRNGAREYAKQLADAGARRAAAPPGTPLVHLQQIGKTPAKRGGTLKPGDTLVYNFGSTAKVTRVRDHSSRLVEVTLESGGKSYTQRMGRDRLVAYDPR